MQSLPTANLQVLLQSTYGVTPKDHTYQVKALGFHILGRVIKWPLGSSVPCRSSRDMSTTATRHGYMCISGLCPKIYIVAPG